MPWWSSAARHSNNTRELVRTCADYCDRVHHVEHEGDVRAEWLIGVSTLGLTAGTSTPDAVIDRVERRIHALTETLRESRTVVREEAR